MFVVATDCWGVTYRISHVLSLSEATHGHHLHDNLQARELFKHAAQVVSGYADAPWWLKSTESRAHPGDIRRMSTPKNGFLLTSTEVARQVSRSVLPDLQLAVDEQALVEFGVVEVDFSPCQLEAKCRGRSVAVKLPCEVCRSWGNRGA